MKKRPEAAQDQPRSSAGRRQAPALLRPRPVRYFSHEMSAAKSTKHKHTPKTHTKTQPPNHTHQAETTHRPETITKPHTKHTHLKPRQEDATSGDNHGSDARSTKAEQETRQPRRPRPDADKISKGESPTRRSQPQSKVTRTRPSPAKPTPRAISHETSTRRA